MQGNRNSGEKLEDVHKLKYLELKCKYHPDEVLHAIKSFVIPYEESLAICQKYRNLLGTAYIMSKIRNIGEALKIYIQIVDEKVWNYLECQDSSQLADAKVSYDMILEICKKESDEMVEEGVKYFDQFLESLFDLYARLCTQDAKAAQELLARREISAEARREGKMDNGEEQAEQDAVQRLGLVRGLKEYVKQAIFDHFLNEYVSRAGTKGLAQVGSQNEPENCRKAAGTETERTP